MVQLRSGVGCYQFIRERRVRILFSSYGNFNDIVRQLTLASKRHTMKPVNKEAFRYALCYFTAECWRNRPKFLTKRKIEEIEKAQKG